MKLENCLKRDLVEKYKKTQRIQNKKTQRIQWNKT